MSFKRVVELALLALGVIAVVVMAYTIADFSHVGGPTRGPLFGGAGK